MAKISDIFKVPLSEVIQACGFNPTDYGYNPSTLTDRIDVELKNNHIEIDAYIPVDKLDQLIELLQHHKKIHDLKVSI